MTDESSGSQPLFSLARYRQLADFRYQVRRYLQYSERVARSHNIEPQQHQLMLAIKGLPPHMLPTVSSLAARLCLKHHSTVELINRLVDRGAAVRKQSTQDRRQVLVELTPQGEELLATLASEHAQELQANAHDFVTQAALILNTPPEATRADGPAGSGPMAGHVD